MFTLLDTQGSMTREKDSTHVVSCWHLPGGYDVLNAQVVKVYFPDLVSATVFAEARKAPPEMALVYEIEDHPDKSIGIRVEEPTIYDTRELQKRLTGG